MALFDRWFKKQMAAPKAVEVPDKSYDKAGAAIVEDQLIQPEATTLDAATITQYYIRNSWVRKYVDSITKGCIKYPLQAVPNGTKGTGSAQKHADEVNLLLANPNKYESFKDIREKYLRDLLLFGNAAVELAPQTTGAVKEIFTAPGYCLRAIVDSKGNFIDEKKSYYFIDPVTGSPAPIQYPYSSVIHFKYDQLSIVYMVVLQ